MINLRHQKILLIYLFKSSKKSDNLHTQKIHNSQKKGHKKLLNGDEKENKKKIKMTFKNFFCASFQPQYKNKNKE
jgi:hypothetical protein